ncbi:MAG: hypothetical protein WCK11_05080 [Candidatus Falkowbacteria bacterium]
MITIFSKISRNLQYYFLICLTMAAVFGFSHNASAGFGISPPYLKNQQLVPGSKYEQQITLLRSSAEEDLKANLKVNAPEIASWISIDKGEEFILPKGQVQVPMLVTVNVPKNAELGNYKGNINIKISSVNTQAAAGVAIALGARIDIDLTLTNVANSDFVVKTAAIPDFELLKWPWKWKIFSYFLQRVSVVLNIENIGNVKTAPSKVSLEVFDIGKTKQLQLSVDKSLDKIDSFSTKEITAHFRTDLDIGQYWGKVKVYKGNDIVNVYEIAFTIAKPGELPNGGPSLGLYPWLLLGGYIIILIVVLFILIKIKIWRLTGKGVVVILGQLVRPLRPIFGGLFRALGGIKAAFWRWVGKQASKYSDDKSRKDR